MPRFATQKWLNPFINNELGTALKSPISFLLPRSGAVAHGYPATVLADICDAILEADKQGRTTSRQAGIEELQPWTLTFPIEFYEQICRLRGWPDILSIKRPSVVGHMTNDIVYERLAPGVLDELRERNPTLPEGYRRTKHHQWLTPELGHPKLREHLAGVTALMRASPSLNIFRKNLDRAYPKTGVYRPPEAKPKATLDRFFGNADP